MKKGFGEKVLKRADRKVVFVTTFVTTVAMSIMYIFVTWSVGFTSSVDFCTVNCHEMTPQYREWQTSSHYNNDTGVVAECADCHLPPSFIPKMMAKTYYGVRDTLVHYFGDPENLDRKKMGESAAASIVNASCQTCHKNLFPSGLPRGGFLAHRRMEGEKQKCVSCHRHMAHQNRIYFDS